MHPTLKDGDYLLIERGKSGNLINQIIAFYIGKSRIVHRVIDEKDNFVLTKGDANQISDGWIPRQAIMGKVVFVLPFWFFDSLRVLAIIAFILIIFVLLIKLRRKKLSRNREEKNAST